jgi:hypothetical protein
MFTVPSTVVMAGNRRLCAVHFQKWKVTGEGSCMWALPPAVWVLSLGEQCHCGCSRHVCKLQPLQALWAWPGLLVSIAAGVHQLLITLQLCTHHSTRKLREYACGNLGLALLTCSVAITVDGPSTAQQPTREPEARGGNIWWVPTCSW